MNKCPLKTGFIDIKPIPNFRAYLDERMRVLQREMYTEVDEYGVSRIVNDFIEHISKNPDDNYEEPYQYFDTAIEISYKPTHNSDVHGETRYKHIYLYTPYSSEKHLEIKYTLVHELVHMTHQILSENERPYEDLDMMGKIRHKLIRQNINNMNKELKFIPHILYMEDKNETFALNQNVYIWSFKYKKENPHYTNKEIIDRVFRKIKIDAGHLSLTMRELKNLEDAYRFIVILLVGHFHEFGKSGMIRYFDKHIYDIPFIKKMRDELRMMLKKHEFNLDKVREFVENLIVNNWDNFCQHKSEIIESFANNLEHHFGEMKKLMSKPVQLGIDDAMMTK